MSAATEASTGLPTWGELVERWCCEHLGLRRKNGPNFDARTSDGTPVQIKGTQRRIENGNDYGTKGRFRLWSGPLLHLLADEGTYLFVLYDPEADPESEAFVERYAYRDPVTVGELADGSWYDGHRSNKGRTAKVSWPEVFG